MVSLRALALSQASGCETKGRFSELAEAVGDDENAGGSQQGQDDAAESVLTPIQALVGQQPGAVVLDHVADRAQPRAVRLAYPADLGLDAVPQTHPAVLGAVITGVAEQSADTGAHGQG